jgi:hypothetical protein
MPKKPPVAADKWTLERSDHRSNKLRVTFGGLIVTMQLRWVSLPKSSPPVGRWQPTGLTEGAGSLHEGACVHLHPPPPRFAWSPSP